MPSIPNGAGLMVVGASWLRCAASSPQPNQNQILLSVPESPIPHYTLALRGCQTNFMCLFLRCITNLDMNKCAKNGNKGGSQEEPSVSGAPEHWITVLFNLHANN
ncbi:hypothetical protein B0O80DRAFT_436714 [Mortierella sp. GBAus27b]|nr:hypothetical protein B0O80DRAFT_436714 [Mortierella sp. GBAus27b]